jgi:hypothetical protein
MSTFVWETNSTVINRLRIRSAERDAHSLQLRLTAMLNAAELNPPALAASAILIVRKLGRELPPVHLDRHSVRPPPGWQTSVSETLDVLARRAARPASGANVSEDDSVLFLDRSEILACLACDWMDGGLLSRWWWRCLFPREDLVKALLSAWSESPTYIPPAMERLARAGKAAPFVLQLPPTLVTVLIQAILRAFALREMERAIETLRGETWPVSIDVDRAGSPHESVASAKGTGNGPGDRPPWTPWVPEANGQELKLDQRLLVMTALMLQRAPHVLRQRTFAAELRQWGQQAMEQISEHASGSPMGAMPREQHPLDAIASSRAIRSFEFSDQQPAPSSAGESEVFEPESRMPPLHSREQYEQPAAEWSVAVQAEFASSEENDVELRKAEEEDRGAPSGFVPVVEMGTGPEFCLAQPFDGIEMETQFGGVFYLINLAIYLGFYGDFSTPAEPGIDLPIWDFLALTGNELLGGALRDDPVWMLFATLSGRTGGEEPGHNFDPPVDELGAALDGPSRLQAWLKMVLEQVRARLRLDLALEQSDDPGVLLLRHPARVQATATHLDVFLSLNELPVPIRIARLDRDPGWVPAAGRHIEFHFV